jgi:phage terminase small subunit
LKAEPKLPAHLSAASRAWCEEIRATFELEAHHERLLVLAAAAFDQAEDARARLAADGTYVEDRFGQLRLHPAANVLRDARLSFARLVRELGIEPDHSQPNRPPKVRG